MAGQIKWAVDKGKLAKVEIVKETAKTYTVGSYDEIMGYWWFGKRTLKEDFQWYDTATEAIAAVISRIKLNIANLESHIEHNRDKLVKLTELAATLEAAEKDQDHAE